MGISKMYVSEETGGLSVRKERWKETYLNQLQPLA